MTDAASTLHSETAALFAKVATRRGLNPIPPQDLVVPYFTSEFNRCMEHERLNAALATCAAPVPWFQVAPACRINDTRKVDVGNHLTVFNALCAVKYFGQDDPVAKDFATRVAIEFLCHELSFDVTNLSISLFGGFDGPQGKRTRDFRWAELWKDAGIGDDRITYANGFKNYMLFCADGERCGPRAEVSYAYDTPAGRRTIEVGTAILDDALMMLDGSGQLVVQPARRCAAGIAFGLERVLMAKLGLSSMMQLPDTADMVAIVLQASSQDMSAKTSLRGDCYILVDQVRTLVFLSAFGVDRANPHQRTLLDSFRARVRRKIEILAIDDWQDLLRTLESSVISYNERLYPILRSVEGGLVDAIAALPWPTTWNPDSYRPSKRER